MAKLPDKWGGGEINIVADDNEIQARTKVLNSVKLHWDGNGYTIVTPQGDGGGIVPNGTGWSTPQPYQYPSPNPRPPTVSPTQTCNLCGAEVLHWQQKKHADWHEALNTLLDKALG